MAEEKLISKKKTAFKISKELDNFLERHSRKIYIPIFYEDLLRFEGGIEILDKAGKDTLWLSVYYNEFERDEINDSLKKIYTILHGSGNTNLQYLNVDSIAFCTFGNSKPFRIKIRNILNDNYTYMYIKIADASRVYGLELEHILSPNNITYLVYDNTLIEEHISGIPGDIFINEFVKDLTIGEKKQISKEFVKFNERSVIRLLGDMRSYNYVIVPTHDFDHVQYRIRAIDFDQQSYEGNIKVYMPQFMKENYRYVKMVTNNLQKESIEQYKIEERSIMARRILGNIERIKDLINCMLIDKISTNEKVKQLAYEIYKEYKIGRKIKRSKSMGEILKQIFEFVIRNYKDMNDLYNTDIKEVVKI